MYKELMTELGTTPHSIMQVSHLLSSFIFADAGNYNQNLCNAPPSRAATHHFFTTHLGEGGKAGIMMTLILWIGN